MWYIALAGIYLMLYLRNDIAPVHRWLHEPVMGTHAANVHGMWLGGTVLVTLIVVALITHRTGEAVPGMPRDTSWVLGLAFAFVGFLWYLVQVGKKPAVTIVRVTAAPSGHPVPPAVVHTPGVNWELVTIVGIGGVVTLAVLYFVVRYIL